MYVTELGWEFSAVKAKPSVDDSMSSSFYKGFIALQLLLGLRSAVRFFSFVSPARLSVPVATLVFLCASFALAGTERWERHNVLSTPDSEAEHIVSTWDGGEWEYKGMYGFFRVLYSENEASAKTEMKAQRVYLQWVRTDEGFEEVGYSIAIKELSSVPSFTFTEPVCLNHLGELITVQAAESVSEADVEQCELIGLTAEHIYEGTSFSFSIKIGGLGQYTLLMRRNS